ncbi:lantibiotic immunity ABC transporter MutE/EpiE family permease subunit [Lysinibacillus sp. ZYM-1]|uniref:lantibiotic immunity ABC transporter MutE/EpiE family permease subunit n=1 Tax=Lysinibacillus sp. ZYM-1 TaxID=1681184 RepID=UPI0006CEA899|nr:lantibiotic immunity ABC transporter MutE/EpiE family permease subunit [Lysinibacillus sp. ZYM-1]KPN93210.1 lantibiotic ABC transporter permease [Lysinibacillus sp. ZYM-1]
MLSILKAEQLKWKRTFISTLLWLTPLVTWLLSAVLMGGSYFQTGAYNWWYTMLLPGALTICCALVVEIDKKMKYQSILALPLDLKKIWLGKILSSSMWLLFISVIFFIGITVGGWLFGHSLSLSSSLVSTIVIFITFLWQIPLCLFLAAKLGTYLAILFNLVANIVGIVVFADGELWYIYPFAIGARLICSTIGILPNGLSVPEGSPLLNTNVIFLGIIMALAWFIIVSFLTAKWFQKREAK